METGIYIYIYIYIYAYCISRSGLDWIGRVKRGLVKKNVGCINTIIYYSRTSQVKIRGIITLNINVYNTNKSTNKIHNLI